jgi:hypothetical protein
MILTEIDYDALIAELALAGEMDDRGELLGRDDSVERLSVAEAKRRYRDFLEV